MDFRPTNKGYYFFGVSPEINLAGYDAHLERFRFLTLRIKSFCCGVEFWGALFREEKGAVHRLTGAEPIVVLDEDWREYTLSLEKFIEGDLSVIPADESALKKANLLEFYFRSQESGTLFIDWVRLHD